MNKEYIFIEDSEIFELRFKDNDKFSCGDNKYLVDLRKDIITEDNVLEQVKRVIENLNGKENNYD